MKPGLALLWDVVDPFKLFDPFGWRRLPEGEDPEPDWVPPPIPTVERFSELCYRLETWLMEKSGGERLFVAPGIDIGPGPYRKIHIVGPKRPVPFSPGAYLDLRIARPQSEWVWPLPDEWFGLPVRVRFNQNWSDEGWQ